MRCVCFVWLLFFETLSQQAEHGSESFSLRVGTETISEDERFVDIRHLFGVPDDFLEGSRLDLSRFQSLKGQARSSFVALSRDGFYTVQPLKSKKDWQTLHGFLDDYLDHVHRHKDSLLPRFLTAFQWESRYWIATFNWRRTLPAGKRKRSYELKGSTCTKKANDRLVRVPLEADSEHLPTLKDLNFVQIDGQLRLPHADRVKLLDQIEFDTDFLKERGIVDYSMSVSVAVVGQCDEAALEMVCPRTSIVSLLYKSTFQEDNGFIVSVGTGDALMYVYAIGLVNVLTKYTFGKSTTAIGCGGKQKADIVKSDDYRTRFVQFFEERTSPDGVRKLSPEEDCSIAPTIGHRVQPFSKALVQLDGRRLLGETTLGYHCRLKRVTEREAEPEGFFASGAAAWALFALLLVAMLLSCTLFRLWQAGGSLFGGPSPKRRRRRSSRPVSRMSEQEVMQFQQPGVAREAPPMWPAHDEFPERREFGLPPAGMDHAGFADGQHMH